MDIGDVLITLVITIVGILIALLIDKSRVPKIKISIIEVANADITFPHGQGPGPGYRWKYFRAFVENKKMPLLLKWLLRQTAENCRALITISGIDNPINFTFKGRWASTPELPFYKDSAIIKLFDPDPVTILAGENEILDIVIKHEEDK